MAVYSGKQFRYVINSFRVLLIYFGDGDSVYIYPDNTPPTVWDNISHQYIGDTITYTDTTYYIEIIGFNDCGQSNFIDSVLVKPLDIQSFFTTIFFTWTQDLHLSLVFVLVKLFLENLCK